MAYFDGDDYLDGPGLADWLEAEALPEGYRAVWPHLARKMNRWRQDRARADLRDLEQELCALGVHPAEFPDELWNVRQRRQTGDPRRENECRNGHPRTPQNTGWRRGHRECIPCRMEQRERERQARRAARVPRPDPVPTTRQVRALALREAGWHWQDIADELGYSQPAGAYVAAKRARELVAA